MDQSIIELRAFKDNYIWVIIDHKNNAVTVVDPGSAEPVLSFLAFHSLILTNILITHHHHDHSGGVGELKNRYPKVRIFGSSISKVPLISHPVSEGDFLASLNLQVLAIPGHTLDHLAFYNDEMVFCGDTLFSGGCGRVFEGTFEEMYQSLEKLKSLPPQTKIYCGHEYTSQNLLFAQMVEPENMFIANKIERVRKVACTLPSSLAEEKLFNPFLRCEEKNIIRRAEKYVGTRLLTPTAVFECLRNWKNEF